MTSVPHFRGSIGALVVLACAFSTPRVAQAVGVKDTPSSSRPRGSLALSLGRHPTFAQPGIDDVSWTQARVPTRKNSWHERWSGAGWYRLHLNIDDVSDADPMSLLLGPARSAVEVYFNGSLLATRGRFGSRPRGDANIMPLAALIPTALLRAGDNVIAVRVDPSWAGGLTGGPLLVGPLDAISEQLHRLGLLRFWLRVGLALSALAIGLGPLLTHLGRRSTADTWWLAGAGCGLATYFLQHLGLLTTVIPNLELAIRLPMIGIFFALFCWLGFANARFLGVMKSGLGYGPWALLVLFALSAVVPESLIYLAAGPVLFLGGLGVSVYCAGLLARAAGRQDRGAISIFAGLVVLILAIVYDGITFYTDDVAPPLSACVALGVMFLAALTHGRQTVREHEESLVSMFRLRKEARVRVGLLDATLLASDDPQRFLGLIIQRNRARTRSPPLLIDSSAH